VKFALHSLDAMGINISDNILHYTEIVGSIVFQYMSVQRQATT